MAKMKGFACVFGLVLVVGLTNAIRSDHSSNEDHLVDPVSRQLFDFKEDHKKPSGLLTTSAGKPVDYREVFNLNGDVLTNQFFIDTIQHLVNERIPEREVVAKGTGAFGYFEVTNDVTKYTKAKLFEKVGKKTQLVARLATSQIRPGGSDSTPVAIRGFSLKMYTEEGNWDILNINIPVYTYRDPVMFAPAVHALAKNPKTNINDFTTILDFTTLHPETLHAFLWLNSEYGLPRGFRRMNGFPIHTFQIYNKHGESFFVRFKFLSELGYDSFNLTEAAELSGSDPDFFIRDLYNAIESKHYPSWSMEMDVLNDKVENCKFDPFDVTNIWPNGTYHTVKIGRVVLNKNVDNQFAQVEQATFNPANLVPGILGPRDQVFRGRIIAYSDAHIHRVGINHNKIEVNCPLYAKNYNRDGRPPTLDNGKDSPNYFPNSFNGPEPYVDEARPKELVLVRESRAIDLHAPRRLYNQVLIKESQKQRLIDSLVQLSLRVADPVTQKFADLLKRVDHDLAKRYIRGLEVAKKTTIRPNVVEDIPKPLPEELWRRREEWSKKHNHYYT